MPATPRRPLPIEPLLTKHEAAEILGCHYRTIENLVARGELVAVRPSIGL